MGEADDRTARHQGRELDMTDTRPLMILLPDLTGGGAEKVALALTEHWRRNQMPTVVVAGRAEGELSQKFAQLDGITLNRTRRWSLLAAVKCARRIRPRAVIAFYDYYSLAFAILMRLLSPRTVVIATIHTDLVALSKDERGRRLKQAVRWSAKHILRTPVVAVSASLADSLVPRLIPDRKRVRVIHNPVVTDLLLQCFASPRDGQVPEEYKGSGLKIVVGIGRLAKVKDWGTLIRAIALTPFSLYLIGEGPERRGLEELATELGVAERVRFLGYRENIYPYIRCADVLVLTSRFEGLSNVIVEAFALETPVVTTDCPYGPRELVASGAGVLVSVGDHLRLAQAIGDAIANPSGDLRDVGRRFRRTFTVTAAAEAYLAAVEDSVVPRGDV